MTKSDGIKMFCFDSPIKCKRAPSVEKILKSFHVDNTCSRRYNCSCIYAFNTCVLKTWTKLIIVSVKTLLHILLLSQMGSLEQYLWKMNPGPGSRLRLQATGSGSGLPLQAQRLQAQHDSYELSLGRESGKTCESKSWTRFRARGSGSKFHHDYKEAKLSIKFLDYKEAKIFWL